MQSAAFLEARRQGRDVFPILDVTWVARGYTPHPRGVYSPSARLTDIGHVTEVTRPGGWEEIPYGSGIQRAALETVTTSVAISDADRSLINMLETYDPRGSVANINWATDGLVEEDWEPAFRGIVSDWAREEMYTKLILKTDDTVLRTIVPAGEFSRTEWSSTFDATIFGTHLPLVTGIHDAFFLTGRGMVPAVNIRYDKDIGYWWLASGGNLVDIRRVYYDGALVSDDAWSVLRGVYGGNLMTIINIGAGYQPEAGVVVSFDCEGPDSDGLAAGSAVTGAVQQLRMVLEEYVYRDPPLGAWRGDHSIIDDASWDATATFFDDRGYDCGRRFGGNQNARSAAEVVQSFLDAYLFARIWWTPLGKLALGVIDPDDVDPDATLWLDLEAHNVGGQVPFGPGDRREVYTHLKQPYMWSSAEQKYMSAYEAHDVAALPEKVILPVPNPWTQAPFNNDRLEEERRQSREGMRALRARNPELARAKSRAWAKANPGKVATHQRRTYLRRKDSLSFKRSRFGSTLKCRYGMTLADFDGLLIAQSGRCAICAEPLFKPNVDHHHESGKVRGLLCDGCNICVGHLEDVARREAATRYLARFNNE